MVWVFPVPGGPCTKTPPCSSSCCAIRICSGLAGLLSSTSPSAGAEPLADGCAVPASGTDDSSPTIFNRDQGKSSRVRRSARMPSIAAANPKVRERRKRTGSRPTHGSVTSASGARSSKNSPRGESCTTNRFRKREFGYRCVKLQLPALQENRMKNPTVPTAPTQDAIAEDKLDALGLAIDAAIQRVERLEDFHRCASGLFHFYPFIAEKFPTLEASGPGRIISERHNRRCCADFGFFQCRPDRECTRRIVPTIFQPGRNLLGRFGRARQPRALHFQNVVRAARFRILAVSVLCF